jgi:hypothetical protein
MRIRYRTSAGRPPRAHELARRQGATIQEAIVSLLIVSVVLVLVVQLVAGIARQQRVHGQRWLALREVGNVMEQMMSRPWAELTSETAEKQRLSEEARRRLPGATLRVRVISEDERAEFRRITVQIAWPEKDTQPLAPVRLVAWRYRGLGGES